MRPAHIHIMVLADGYHPLVTQIYPDDDKYLERDAVFAVKGDLVVNFKKLEGDKQATHELPYDFTLYPKKQATGTNGH
jgi:protocatechuate 3,4-dioxygenase beta subunit